MVQISVSPTEAIKIGGDFFSEYVVLPAPSNYLNRQEAEHATLEIFSKVMRIHGMYDDDAFQPIRVDEFIDRVRNIIIDEISEELMYHDERHGDVADIVNNVITTGEITSGDSELIYCEHILIQFTRLIIQNVYDDMRNKRTHLHVDNPLDVNTEKWSEVTSLPDETASITMNVSATKAVEITGRIFNERVIIPIPNTVFMAYPEAKSVAENMFEWVCEYIDEVSKNRFTGVKSEAFITDLHHVLKDILCEECDKVSNTCEDDIDDVLSEVLPNNIDSMELPAEIWSEGVLVHITRMVLQTLFDVVVSDESHMSVDNPFAVRDHKWNEINIQ